MADFPNGAKEEWMRYSPYSYGSNDKWIFERISSLFDLVSPSPLQQQILRMADLQLTLGDLPLMAYPTHDAELRALVQREFGDQPMSTKT